MLQEDQNIVAAAQYEADGQQGDDEYYDEENLPDERVQTELIRRMHHNEVQSEAETTLKMFEDL